MATVLTIGTFDGVHLGHQALIDRARTLAVRATSAPAVVALVFDPHPLEILRPAAAPGRLSAFVQRERWLLAAGADRVVRLEPTPDLLSLTPEDFVSRIVHDYAPVGFVEGRDFRFGRARAGDVHTLARLGNQHGFEIAVVEPVMATLGDHSEVTVSSTLVRWLIRHGRVRDAAALLGRPYAIPGEVVRGDRRGRTIGYPTANIATPCLLPAEGIYAGRARLADGRTLAAGVHVGNRPTFPGASATLEAYLMAESTDPRGTPAGSWSPLAGLPEYGWTVELEFIAWLRDQIKFESVPPLLEQMARDCERAKSLAEDDHAYAAPAATEARG
jgi:riboflavin kinase/FMN adenylyltransferase